MRDDALRHGGWYLPDYRPGDDETWDRLGDDWRAIEGLHEAGRVYVRWQNDGGRTHISGLCLDGAPITTDTLRSIPVGRLENLAATVMAPRMASTDDLSPLTRERGSDPEEFAERVATYYRVFAAASDRPAKEMAEHSGVPVGTVRGWIREARLRGKLPPGRQGKAG